MFILRCQTCVLCYAYCYHLMHVYEKQERLNDGQIRYGNIFFGP